MTVPWKAVRDNPVKYLSADSLPKDTSICEPSKLTYGQVANLWNHWAKRQKAHVQGVEFISARPHDRRESMEAKGKKKAAAFINPGEHDQPQAGPSNVPHTPPPQEDPLPEPVNPAWSSGESFEITERSPAAHCEMKKSRMAFLTTLCKEDVYVNALRGMSQMKVLYSYFCTI